MHEAVHAGQQVDKSAVGFDAHDLPGVDFADLDLFGQRFDLAAGFLRGRSVQAGDKDRSVFFDIDLDLVSLLQPTHGLAARPDNLADFFRVHAHCQNARRVRAELLPRFRQDFQHLFHDVQPPQTSLLQRDAQNLEVQPLDLQVHLQGGDTMLGAGDFEIHIPQIIFDALNVGQHRVGPALLILDQAHCNAGHRGVNRNTCVHERQGAAADRAHTGGTVAAYGFADQPQGVREIIGNHRLQGPFGQRAVADLPPFRPPHRVGLAGRVGGKVVMMDIPFVIFRLQGVHPLRVPRRTQRRYRKDVRFASHEQSAAMHLRKVAHLHLNRAHCCQVPTVGAHAVIQDTPTNCLSVQVVQRTLHILGVNFGRADRFGESFQGFRADGGDAALAFIPVRCFADYRVDLVTRKLVDLLYRRLRGGKDGVAGEFLFTQLRLHLLDRLNGGLHPFVGQAQTFHHDIFRQLARAGFHHQDIVGRAGDLQAKCA